MGKLSRPGVLPQNHAGYAGRRKRLAVSDYALIYTRRLTEQENKTEINMKILL